MVDEIEVVEEETINIELDNDILVLGDMKKEVYDTNNNGVVDNAEKVNNHTVEADVPEDAVFTDTIYDDAEIKQDIFNIKQEQATQNINIQTNASNISDLQTNKADKSEIPDVSNFITNSVDNLLNYYKKSETFTKQEVNDLISAITTMDLQVVQTLPTQDISTTTIYLVPKNPAETNNAYDEYIYVSNNWEFIGSTEVDLTDYVKNTDYATASTGGVVKPNTAFGSVVAESGSYKGVIYPTAINYASYEGQGNNYFISKGTLENVITGKGLVSNTDYANSSRAGVIKIAGETQLYTTAGGLLYAYPLNYSTYTSRTDYAFINKGTLENVLNARIGDINTVLDSINGEVI